MEDINIGYLLNSLSKFILTDGFQLMYENLIFGAILNINFNSSIYIYTMR